MSNFVVYLLLGLGAGSAYALLANGIVATYKGSGILNFAQGGIAMFATYCYLALIGGGTSKYVALVIVIAGAATGGALLAVAVIRPIRNAPVLAKVVVTLGLLTALQGGAALIWGNDAKLVPSLFPTHGIDIGGAQLGVDRLYMFATAVVVGLLLWAGFRYTRLGLATQAASENERGAALLGFSPTVTAAINWALGCALAALAGALIAPLTGLDETKLPLVVLPALAAALAGRFSSLGITTAAAVIIGCVQSELLNLWSQQGVQEAAPFVVVVLVMIVLGRGIPSRGAADAGRPPTAAGGRIRWWIALPALGVAVIALANLNITYQGALATSFTSGVLALSLVVVTGYVGQVSLMQMTFAGVGGFFTAKLAYNLGVPFPLPIICSAIIVALVGALLGLPALRVRGLALAVVTLGASITIDAIVFQNQSWAGGQSGVQLPSPALGGFSLDPFLHPMRYGMLCLVGLVISAVAVSNLRRSGAGRRMLAVRSNERAAAVAGINVRAVKLQAFTISSVIAAIGGGLLAYSNPFLVLGTGQFAAMPSITLLTVAYIGSIASISGAILAGLVSTGGILYVALSGISGFDNWYVLVSGIGLIWVVMQQPDGVAVYHQRLMQHLVKRLRRSPTEPPTPPAVTALDATATTVEPSSETVS